MNYPTLKNGERNWCATCKNDDTFCDYEEECFYPQYPDGTYNHNGRPTHYEDKVKPKTNYDILISKTPEELARFVTRTDLCSLTCGEPCIPCDGACERHMFDWLKSPVKVGD